MRAQTATTRLHPDFATRLLIEIGFFFGLVAKTDPAAIGGILSSLGGAGLALVGTAAASVAAHPPPPRSEL